MAEIEQKEQQTSWRDKFAKYGHGMFARIALFVCCVLVDFLGVHDGYSMLRLWAERKAIETGQTPWILNIWFSAHVFGKDFAITPLLTIAVGVFLAVAVVPFFFMFMHHSTANYLIEVEGEMRKVSWPASAEYLPASFAVIVITIFMVLFLAFGDYVLSNLAMKLNLGF